MMEARRLKKAVMIGCALVAAGLAAQNAAAVERTYWVLPPPAAGYWFEPTNWDNGVPSLAGVAYIDNGGTAQIASGSPRAMSLYVGYDHSGAVEQTGGTLQLPSSLYLGYHDAASEGRYTLEDGSISCSKLHVGYYGDGVFTQTGGTVTVTNDVYTSSFGGDSLYELSGTGVLNTVEVRVGMRGTGTFRQTGGTHTCSEKLQIGYESTGFGTYELGGTGVLTAEYEAIGYYDNVPGLFKQFGGSHTVARLHIRPLGRYEFTGGQLRVNKWLEVDGELTLPAGGAGNLTLGQGAFANLSATAGHITNPGNLSIHTEPNTLVMFPAGFDPHATFKSFTGDAEVHYPGMTLYVPPGCTAYFRQTFDDHVRCEGTLLGIDGSVDLTSGIEVSGGGVLDAGESADITIEDLTSGISGGRIRCKEQFIGYSGTARFTQTGGTNSLKWQIWLGHEVGSDGTYEMSNGLLEAGGIYVGREGTGTFTQTGGTATLSNVLFVAYGPGSEGTVEISAGRFSARYVAVGEEGQGHFIQSGGHVTVREGLAVGGHSGGTGTYELGGTGTLEAVTETVGQGGSALFTQTGGTNTVTSELRIGTNSSGQGIYELSGGSLLAHKAILGGTSGTGLLTQTGGTAALEYVEIGPGGRYEYTGGNLRIGRQLMCTGQFDFAHAASALNFADNALVNFTDGQVVRSTNATVTAGANSLVIFPAGFDPDRDLHSYISAGVTGVAGQAIVVPAGCSFVAEGELTEHVQCYGTISTCTGARLNLLKGLEVFPGGSVDLDGRLYINNTVSGMSGGTLTITDTLYLGEAGETARFVQTGGTHTLVADPNNWSRGTMFLAYKAGSTSTYELQGGDLSMANCYLGFSGTGTFKQTGGTNTVAGYLSLGMWDESAGTYELAGTGRLNSKIVFVGRGCPGSFKQSGDSQHTISEEIIVGANSTYELSGGTLSAPEERIGGSEYAVAGTMKQTGGSNSTGRLFVTSKGHYELSGGLLDLALGAAVDGQLDFAGGAGALNVQPNAFVNLSQGTISNGGAATVNAAHGSVIMFPAGFDPGRDLGHYYCAGVTHVAGAPLEIPVGYNVLAWGTLYDQLRSAGAFTAYPGESIHLPAGVHVSGSGNVDLGGGEVTVNDTTSGISGGTLKTGRLVVGDYGTGVFTQTGGTVGGGPYMKLYLGRYGSDAQGTYLMSGGQLTADWEDVGYAGKGHFVHTAGTNTVGHLQIASQYYSEGTYELGGTGTVNANHVSVGDHGTGLLKQTGSSSLTTSGSLVVSWQGTGSYEMADGTISARFLIVGSNRSGTFKQDGGTVTVTDSLYLGTDWWDTGQYDLVGGLLQTGSEIFGVSGQGIFTQSGGVHKVAGALKIAHNRSMPSFYNLSGGHLTVGTDCAVGYLGEGVFTQTGGTNTVAGSLILGQYDDTYSDGKGTYDLGGGSLDAKNVTVGQAGDGHFRQAAGTVTVGRYLILAESANARGTYDLSGTGRLSAKYEYIGRYGTGTFTQTGGTHAVTSTLYLGRYSGSNGTYTMSAGNLSAAGFIVGSSGSGTYTISAGRLDAAQLLVSSLGQGTLNITDRAADISVSARLRFGSQATLSAVPGATIHMTGAAFQNASTDPAALAGLRNLELIFEGGSGDTDPFEVACEDRGRSWDGFQENFALGGLTLGGADIGQVRLVDHFDNQPAWEGSEALYVEDLFLSADSYLDLNGLNLYYLRLKDLGGTVETDGGHLTQIPVDVGVDVKPGSCPNPLNVKGRGVLPVAVLGTEEFDVMTIDPSSIFLGREGIEDGLAPLRWAFEDVAAPFEGDPGDCHDLDDDGYLDLTLKFKTQDLVELLALGDEAGGLIHLTLTGSQTEEGGGYGIEGTDCVWVLVPGDADADLDVDATDLASLGMNWAPSGTHKVWLDADFDGDGDVDATDLASLGMNWSPGGYVGGAGAGTVPEPVSLSVMGVGLIGIALRKRMKPTA